MTFDQDAPLDRIKSETVKAHTALMDYWLMDAGRSLEKLRQSYVKATSKKAPTIHLRTLQEWSSRYHWQARIARQIENDNTAILEQRRHAQEKITEQYLQRHMSEAEALALLADQARGDMGHFADVGAQTDLANHPQSALVKNIVQHYTQTTKGTGEDSEAETKIFKIALGLYDAQKALELILKHHGAFAADNKHQNLNIDMSNLTDDQLKRIANGEDPLSVISD